MITTHSLSFSHFPWRGYMNMYNKLKLGHSLLNRSLRPEKSPCFSKSHKPNLMHLIIFNAIQQINSSQRVIQHKAQLLKASKLTSLIPNSRERGGDDDSFQDNILIHTWLKFCTPSLLFHSYLSLLKAACYSNSKIIRFLTKGFSDF